MATQIEQGISYQIRVEAGMEERLQRLSDSMGMPSAELASFALESWVAQQERTLAMIEVIGDKVGGDMGSRLKNMLRTGLLARQHDIPAPTRLTNNEVGAIAKHEHLSRVSAAGLGSSLLQSEEGVKEIIRFIRENIEDAQARGERDEAEELERVLAHFGESHRS
jgi:hypothetical protein